MPRKPPAKGRQAETAKKSPKEPRLVPRPDGRGALLDGGKPGNAGGTGRPPSAVRQACREAFDVRIPRLTLIADGTVTLTERCPKCGHTADGDALPVTDVADSLRAMDILGRFGLGERGTAIDREAVQESLRIQRGIIRDMLPKDQARALLERLAEAWD